CVARSYNPHVRNPRTPEQVAHREMFKQEVQLAARMRWAITRTMTDAARAEGITSYNLFVRENQHAFRWSAAPGGSSAQGAAVGGLQVDYSTLRLSIGDVPGVAAESVELDDDNVLSVGFARGAGRAFDEVYLYVYAPELGKGFLSSSAYRRDRRITLALPDDYAGRELHAWLMAKSDDGRWSESSYVDVNSRPGTAGLEPPAGPSSASPNGPAEAEGVVPPVVISVQADQTPPADAGRIGPEIE
ncbi:MAG: hypothetical protein IKR83_00145, partial [Bacteroidales bacterium]|nr:hypothetical protein [Bacteroidales bacterium]